jgi:SAM-dependent methyltransferase
VRLGHATGFDSGSTLDYIYRNQANGRTLLGRIIDRTYLDAIGWRGIRQRKLDVEALLCEGAARLRAIGAPVRLVDIAAGYGRYVLDAIAMMPERPESVLLRDYSDLNVEQGRALIRARNLGDIAHFEEADAFDRTGFPALEPRPTLAVVSGLFELVPDNLPVRQSLAGLAEAIAPGGFLVYTGQPWHPQLELIARALTSHRQGAAWVMRRRTQEELDQLVAAAGFRKVTQRIGESGIFTVSLAQRVAE